jgi:hypothetical protein
VRSVLTPAAAALNPFPPPPPLIHEPAERAGGYQEERSMTIAIIAVAGVLLVCMCSVTLLKRRNRSRG